MIDIYKKLTCVLDRRDKRLALYVLLLTVVVAIIEVMGVASIMPFMAVLTNPSVIQTNPLLSFLYDFLDFNDTESFLFFLGVSVLIFLVGSTFLKAHVVWAHIHYANTRNYSLGSRVVSGYLQQPYSWFLSKNSSNLAAAVLEEVSRVVNGCLYPLMRLVSNVVVAALLLGVMTYADPKLAISAMLILSVSYGAIIKFAGKRLRQKGQEQSEAQKARLQAVNEAFGGVKDVKIGGYENFFIDKFRQPAKKHAMAAVSAKLWAEMPSFAMQALVFSSMMLTILYLMKTRDGFNNAVPVMALYALGIYKLMPAVQEIYKQFVEMRYHQPALDETVRNIQLMRSSEEVYFPEDHTRPMGLQDCIEMKKVKYKYPESTGTALEVNYLRIDCNQTVGIVGGSGAGKTTTVDLLLGLLRPTSGCICVDGNEINEGNLRAWQKSLGYVPQSIYLTDNTVAANIAFGLPQNQVDMDAVIRAAKTAHIHDFIVNELPEGYQTGVGERGMRLSGGQRQRIGIARALYHDPDVLILDEATSALDNVTEKIIMDAVDELSNKKTIIIIAHRLSTIRNSDVIHMFDQGRMVASGSYDELLEKNEGFRHMVQAHT